MTVAPAVVAFTQGMRTAAPARLIAFTQGRTAAPARLVAFIQGMRTVAPAGLVAFTPGHDDSGTSWSGCLYPGDEDSGTSSLGCTSNENTPFGSVFHLKDSTRDGGAALHQQVSGWLPGVIGSVLGLVGPASVYCDRVRWKVWPETSVSVWQHVKLSEQIRP